MTATEMRPAAELGEIAGQLREAGCLLELGGHRSDTFLQQDLIVPSPGVPATLAGLAAARAGGIAIWSEIELASRFLRGRLVAITGSNGKTTTTSLLGHILAGAGKPVIVAGNIGSPLIAHVDESSDGSIAAVEVSSFQLEFIELLRPDVSVWLNLTPDHLDRHGSFEEYARAKMRVFENQTERDAAVLNADDAAVAENAPARPQLYWFSRRKRVASGAHVQGDQIVFRREGEETALLALSDIALHGAHNVENVLAAASAAFLVGVSPEDIASGVRTFSGVEHRLEFVVETGGVRFFNDSKATNVDATRKALEAFPERLLVILGGKDKGSDFRPLREPLRQRAKQVLLIGAASAKIEEQLGSVVPIERAETLDRAVDLAFRRAEPWRHRTAGAGVPPASTNLKTMSTAGELFKELVHMLEAGHAAVPQARKG